MHLISRLICIPLLSSAIGAGDGVGAAEPDFNRDIKPILSENCFFCHGPDSAERKADLRLDTFEGATAEVVVPGDPDASELVARIESDDPEQRMPPPEAKIELSDRDMELLKGWIRSGAEYQEHWSFVPPQKVPLRGGGHPIDQLVEIAFDQQRLQPSPQASREILLRRVSLDLTGLPPTPEEVVEFLNDERAGAYVRVVDRLLASPAYGERMAWNWLDAARYADSNGYQGDNERTMWPWRDWVVKAFNQNMPYDQFTIWQLAGDLLPDVTDESRLATGFCRNHPINGEGGRIAEENRVDYVMDMTETTGTVWLGLTLNCCRCHDHKFDPLQQKDYYQLSDYFNQTPVDGGGGNAQTPPVLAVVDKEGRAQVADLDQTIAELDRRMVVRKGAIAEEEAELTRLAVERDQAVKRRDEFNRGMPKVMVMADREQRRATYILNSGLYSQRGEEVGPGVPEALPRMPDDSPDNRLGLARWIVSTENPLTARVTVNRFWQQLFGIGLVKTSEDFGSQGELPPHQELLDWLAVDFRANGWDLKRLMKLIVTSEIYKQSAKSGGGYLDDPQNRKLARGPRFRMPSWMLRDQALAASGLLVRKLGGKPLNPYQPSGIWEETSYGKKKYQQGNGDDLYRRSLYTFWRRIAPPTAFFDNAGRQVCQVRPLRTNTPLHALYTFNDVTFVEAARVLAEKALIEHPDDRQARFVYLYLRILSRHPQADEFAPLVEVLERSLADFARTPADAEAFLSIGESPRNGALDLAEHAGWTALALAILNLDEAVTKP